MTQISKNFSLEELTYSTTAVVRGINNTPDMAAKARLVETVTCMAQPIRDVYGKGIRVTSGYRCQRLNSSVGGSSTSQHTTGYALDIVPSTASDMANLKKIVLSWAKTHKFDQIIFEQPNAQGVPSWIHIGWKHLTKGQRKQILVAKKVSGGWSYSVYK